MSLDYLSHIAENSSRFADVLREADAERRVPTCPEWRADDLIWHLAEVQWFWGTIVRDDVADPDSLSHPPRPDDREGLLRFFSEASATLQSALASTDPGAPRWTWSDDRTAGFILRRQAHEALIHRVDAELTAEVARAPMSRDLCVDGVDESLRVMFGGCPPWGNIDADPGATVRITATDAARSWLVTVGTFAGTSPEGKEYVDEPAITVADDPGAAEGPGTGATVEAAAADLDCWLWGRPTVGPVARSGDEAVHGRLDAVIAAGIQ